jgi:glucose/arabinose dehydrogenase
LSGPTGLAFDSAGDLFVTENNIFTGDGSIVEITPGGLQSTFASGLGNLYGLAFQPAPEPSVFGLLAASAIALLVCRRQNLLRG